MPEPPGLWILHISLQMFMLTVILLREILSSAADGSAKMLFSVSPKERESGIWAKLKGCCILSSRVTQDSSNLTKGFLTSSRAKIAPLRMQSITFPSSQMTQISTTTFQMYLPESMQSDSGSSAFDPTITVYKSLVVSADSFLFSSAFPWQLWQSTLKNTVPSLGFSFLGAVISTLVLIQTSVAPILKMRWPDLGRK